MALPGRAIDRPDKAKKKGHFVFAAGPPKALTVKCQDIETILPSGI